MKVKDDIKKYIGNGKINTYKNSHFSKSPRNLDTSRVYETEYNFGSIGSKIKYLKVKFSKFNQKSGEG